MTPNRFPSALGRQHGGDTDLDTPRRRRPTKAAIAMMTADQLRDYYQRRGQWAEPDREAIATARQQNDYIGRQ